MNDVSSVGQSSTTELAARWRLAVTECDFTTLESLYHPDARIWTSTDGKLRPLSDHLRRVRAVRSACESWAYNDVRCQRTERGFISQHAVDVVSGGERQRIDAAIVAGVVDGLIVVLDEYLASGRAL